MAENQLICIVIVLNFSMLQDCEAWMIKQLLRHLILVYLCLLEENLILILILDDRFSLVNFVSLHKFHLYMSNTDFEGKKMERSNCSFQLSILSNKRFFHTSKVLCFPSLPLRTNLLL